MTDEQRLEQYLKARHSCISICTYEEAEAITMVSSVAVEAMIPMWVWSSSRGLRQGILSGSSAIADTGHPAGAITFMAQQNTSPLLVMVDLAAHLTDAKTLRLLRDLIEKYQCSGGTLILIDHNENLPECIKAVATPFTLSMPDEQELEQVLRSTLREQNEIHPIRVDLNPRELATIIRNLSGLSARQARRIILDAIVDDWRLDARDINTILAEKRKHFQNAGVLEYVEAPVDMEQIGGLTNLKRWLQQRHKALTPEARDFGISAPRGLLLLGVQGAGKSLSAKAVATAWGRPLMRLDPGILYDRYMGESERRLRDALRQAEMMAPIILWVDEVEKGFASAASQSTDGGLSKRMFGTFLTWLQEHKSPVFTVATANEIEAMPPELLRKGRFDEIFFVDLPSLEARAQILSIHLTKRNRNPQAFDIAALAAASEGFSGAEIEQAIVSALHDAFSERTDLTTPHILTALRNSPPLSVTMAERVADLRAWAQGRCVPAE